MKAETNMCRWKSRAWTQLSGVRPAIALMLGLLMLMQHAMATPCLAEEPGGQQTLTAARPEAGTPPAPATSPSTPPATSAAEAEAPAVPTAEPLPSEEPAPSAEPVQAAEPNPLPTPVASTDPLLSEPASDRTPAAATAAQAEVVEQESNPRNVLRAEADVRELSVSPEIKPLLPAGRPAWVGAAPDLSNPRRHRLFVGSFPTSSVEEADAALDEPMLAAVTGYINEEVLEGHGAQELNLTAEFIRRNLVETSTEYMAELSTSTGPLYQKWVVLEITPEHRKFFAEAYRQVEQKKRMVALGLGLTGLLGLTGVAHFAFNRRRRRYTETQPPVVHTVLHERDVEASKRTGLFLRIIAGGAACLVMLAVLFLGSITLIRHERAPHPITGNASHDVIIYGESPLPPEPPTPPQAPEVYFEQVKAEHDVLKAQSDRIRRLHATWGPIEVHGDIKVEGNGN